MIQGSINQLLQSAAIFGRLAPDYEKKVEMRQLTKQEDVLKGQVEAAKQSLTERKANLKPGELEQDVDVLKQATQKGVQLAEKGFELDPSTETYEKLLKRKRTAESASQIEKDYLAQRQQLAERKAQSALQLEQNRVAKSKRNFMEYLGKQETSLGGTVSELPPAMQKEIASQYSKSQRKSMMNRMDKEDKNK